MIQEAKDDIEYLAKAIKFSTSVDLLKKIITFIR
jgi:hypothetical protein